MDIKGLSHEEVSLLKERGLVNYKVKNATKSILDIITSNFFTLFNLLNFGLALAIFFVGSYKNLLFLGVVFCNTFISTVQEIRSKRVVDKLSLLNETKATVVRDGFMQEVLNDDIVLGDTIRYKAGNQVVVDTKIISGEVLVNEALITGESESISKSFGDVLLSGSFIVSGSCYGDVFHVGMDNYATKISSEAKYVKKINSEIMNFINKILKMITVIIIPIGIFLFMRQFNEAGNLSDAVVSTVAGLIGMIPEGLVLLTSTVLAIGVVRLSKYNVLVQELFCIETLARVDTICLDKTGTITEGNMQVSKVIPINFSMPEVESALGSLSYHLDNDNQTMEAIGKKYRKEDNLEVLEVVPFSSQAKWSGVSFKNYSYVLGAPEIILSDLSEIQDLLDMYTSSSRVVLLAKSFLKLSKKIPDDLVPMALIVIDDRIRKEAYATLNYFKEQGVNIRLISGDNPKTVAGIAKKVGIENVRYVDMSKTDKLISDLVLDYNVFGRVKPNQKKEIIMALQALGHTVAMTGDGVNDVLALKEADCSVAMSSGSDAARNVSQLVLLDSNFASMPKVVAEGRRSINNLQRSSSLFLCKTTYATILAIVFAIFSLHYPFIPIQLTLTSMVTIGNPSFVLALEPNNERINGKIIINVLRKSVPTALTIVFNILAIMFISTFISLSQIDVSTLCVLLTAFTGFMLLYRICVPFNTLRRCLFVFLILLFSIGFVFFKGFFSLSSIFPNLILLVLVLFMLAFFVFNMFIGIFDKICKKIYKK